MPGLSVGVWLALAVLVGGAYWLGWHAGSRRAAAQPPARNAPRVAAPRSLPADASAATGTAAEPLLRPERATLGRYRLERQLGRGSMGAVYLGHDPQIGRAVAIKTLVLSREFEGQELAEARSRFFREAEMAGRLRHPDIVAIFDAGEEAGLAFIAMEYVKGHDLLRHTLPGRLLPVPVVLDTLARVALALGYAHSQGVVHRDIKPANVMIDPDSGAIKVTDFGIASISNACRTRTGLVLGTPSFMSPEQMAGRRVDGRTDLYSLGVMMFQLLTGALPHAAESMAQLMNQIANEPAPDVRTLRPELPEALANVVALALEKRPEVRYADGAQMASDLRAVVTLMARTQAAAVVTDARDSGR
jgi:serine/threonine-protein kinase